MKKANLWTALISSVVTLGVVLLVMNFITGEKKIERTPERRYATDDPQFARSMSVLLGPPIVAGNHVQVLVNGDRIFPAMLAAIAQAQRTISESMQLMYLMAITAARESIQLANSYFVPDAMTTAALAAAAQRGVKVRVIAPGEHIDTELVRKASRAGWGDLLKAGIEIAEFAPTMFHVKSMVVDGMFVSVGSTNFDNRSFRLNDEANLNVLDAGFAKEQIAIFDADWKRARPITHEQWLNRPWNEKALEHLAALLKSQL